MKFATGLVMAAVSASGLSAQSTQATPPKRPAPKTAAVTDSRRSAIVDAARRVGPAVVSVTVVKRERQQAADPFEWFFVPRGAERDVQGLGTGFIVSEDGVVITNQHVTEGASQIAVVTPDGKEYPATLLGEDELTDIAVVKIQASGLPTAPIGPSEDLMIGEWVVAFGNPYGYLLGNTEPTVTAGVVSATGRNLYPSGDQPGVYVGMIQTDAAINPGNSGGPLANANGEVVGVNSSIFSNTGGSVGIGFAIPIERAMRVAKELREHGRVRRAWVGLDIASQGSAALKQIGGIRVSAVAQGSPAFRSGVRAGDVLTRAQGKRLRTFLDWESVKLDLDVGDSVAVQMTRAGVDRRVAMTVEDLPTSRAEKVAVLGSIQVITVTAAIRAERGIRAEKGVLIYRIGDDAKARTSLEQDDVIFMVNRQRITTAEELRQAFSSSQGRSALRVYLERSGETGYTDFYVQ
ncbi:MAG: trypsin-like serine protease [Gemmatimonadetes bacterium]|nr:trypsin-like serine protease [Gemmatimonadota bacterium]